MAFKFLEKNFFRKKKCYIILHFFVYLLLIFINERRPHNTLSEFDEGAIEHILTLLLSFVF